MASSGTGAVGAGAVSGRTLARWGIRKRSKRKFYQLIKNVPPLQGLARIFGVSRNTVARWLKKSPEFARLGGHPGSRSSPRHLGTGRTGRTGRTVEFRGSPPSGGNLALVGTLPPYPPDRGLRAGPAL